jgi:hypothetical protein
MSSNLYQKSKETSLGVMREEQIGDQNLDKINGVSGPFGRTKTFVPYRTVDASAYLENNISHAVSTSKNTQDSPDLTTPQPLYAPEFRPGRRTLQPLDPVRISLILTVPTPIINKRSASLANTMPPVPALPVLRARTKW